MVLSNFDTILFSDMGEAHSEVVRETCAEYGVFFFEKTRFNLAKGLKATQVHNSDTPILSHRDWWGSGQ